MSATDASAVGTSGRLVSCGNAAPAGFATPLRALRLGWIIAEVVPRSAGDAATRTIPGAGRFAAGAVFHETRVLADVVRSARADGGAPIPATVTLHIRTGVDELGNDGLVATTRAEPWDGSPARAGLAAGQHALVVLNEDVTSPGAFVVLGAFGASGAPTTLREAALGVPAGTLLDALFATLAPMQSDVSWPVAR